MGKLNHGKLTQLGDNSYVYVGEGACLQLADNVYIGRQSNISCLASISIDSDVRLAERVSIHDENHLFEPLPLTHKQRLGYSTSPVNIGARVWIGANAVILPGTSIGSDSVIAAGSVVRGQIPSGVLAAGVPARVIRNLITSAESDLCLE